MMDHKDIVDALDHWFDTGGFATSEARALAGALRSEHRWADPDAPQDVFPPDLRIEVIHLSQHPISTIRLAAISLLQAVRRDENR